MMATALHRNFIRPLQVFTLSLLASSAFAQAPAAAQASSHKCGAGSLNLPDGKPLAETLPAQYRGEALGMRGVLDSLEASDITWTFFSPAMSIAPGTRTSRVK